MTLKKLALASALLCVLATPAAHAQSAAKKELISKLLVLQQAGIDNTARGIIEQQPMQMAAAAQKMIMQNVPEDKRQATARAVDAELKKYVEAATPVIQASATKVAQTNMTPILDEKFTEEELRTLVSVLESPVLKKFQGMLPELTDKLLDKIIADARPGVDPFLNKTAANVRQILANASAGSASGAASGKTGSSKPAKK